MDRRQGGTATPSHLLTVCMLAAAGMAGLSTYGGAASRAVAGSSRQGSMAVAAQAGLVSEGAEFGALAERLTSQARATIAGNAFTKGRALMGISGNVHINSSYEEFFGPDFIQALKNLRHGQTWFDMGSGDGVAVSHFLRLFHHTDPSQAPNVVAVAHAWANTDGLGRAYPTFRGLYGRYLEDIPAEELGRGHLITDLYGPLSYSPRFDRVLQRYADLLEPGGEIHAFVAPTGAMLRPSLDAVTGFWPHTQARDFLAQFNERLVGLQADAPAEPQRDRFGGSAFRLKFTKTADTATVPELILHDLSASTPPERYYTFANP